MGWQINFDHPPQIKMMMVFLLTAFAFLTLFSCSNHRNIFVNNQLEYYTPFLVGTATILPITYIAFHALCRLFIGVACFSVIFALPLNHCKVLLSKQQYFPLDIIVPSGDQQIIDKLQQATSSRWFYNLDFLKVLYCPSKIVVSKSYCHAQHSHLQQK